MQDWLVPPPLRPDDAVRVIAPSGPFDHALVWRGLGFLRERYRVRFDRAMFEARGYLAGSDARRTDELARALAEPDTAAIVCARGGYGASRVAHAVGWSALRARPRWLCGFSDATALHVEAAAVRVCSLHGPNLTGLGRSDAAAREGFIAALERPAPRRFAELTSVLPGAADGRLFGGNLALLHACAAARRLRVPAGAILMLEDVSERPYRVDRMLATLVAGGHLSGVAGVILGDFSDCEPGKDGVSVVDVARELLLPLGVPLAAGLPVGHGSRNEPLVLGSRARLHCRRDGAALDLEAPDAAG